MCFDLSQGSHQMAAFDCLDEMLVNQSRRHDTRGLYVQGREYVTGRHKIQAKLENGRQISFFQIYWRTLHLSLRHTVFARID